MNINKLRELVWDLSGCRYIWNKVRPGKNADQAEPSSIVIWLVSLHVALFSLASALYEANKNSYDSKISLVYTLLQINEVKQLGINKITGLQGAQVLLKPNFHSPIDNVKSILRVKTVDSDSELELKRLLKYYKKELNNAFLYQGDFSNIEDLSSANFKNSNLQKSNFKNSNLVAADFSHSDLRGVDFKGADLSFATFYQADLQGANLTDVDGIDFESLSNAYSLFQTKLSKKLETELRLKGRTELFSRAN